MDKIRMGVVGVGQRGRTMMNTILSCDEAEIVAVCDSLPERLEEGLELVKSYNRNIPIGYSDFDEMLKDENVQAVYVSSSWDCHVEMAIKCLYAGKITAMEVGGAYDIEECWALVKAYEETKTPFMMLENCCFDRFELLSTALARKGLLGEIVHCHGAYSHDLRDEITGGNKNKHYRLNNYIKRNCENYPTHEIGPIAKLLGINRGNKFLSLVSVSSKACGLREYIKSGKCDDETLKDTVFQQGDIVNTIIKCVGGETITLTLDTTLPKYYSREFTVRGTKGLTVQEGNMVLIEDKCNMHEEFAVEKTIEKYLNNAKEFDEYLPSCWLNIKEEEKKLGHGGMDYIQFKCFFDAIINEKEMPIDVYDAASWMCITALSEQSINQGGAVQAIPDFTRGKWVNRPLKDVIEL